MNVKPAVRKELLRIMRSTPPDVRDRTDAAICAHILSSEAYRRASVLFLFVGVGAEVDTTLLLKRALADGKTPLCPVAGKEGVMEACAISRWDDLYQSEGGLMEPRSCCPPVPPASIDLTLLPCLSCDPFGIRIGYGGGYYDRYLPLMRKDAMKIAVLRENQISACLPAGTFDAPVDGYFTEAGFFRAAPASL